MQVSVKGKAIPSVFMIYDKQNEKYLDKLYAKVGPAKVAFLNLGQQLSGKYYSSNDEDKNRHRQFAATRYEIHEFELVKK